MKLHLVWSIFFIIVSISNLHAQISPYGRFDLRNIKDDTGNIRFRRGCNIKQLIDSKGRTSIQIVPDDIVKFSGMPSDVLIAKAVPIASGNSSGSLKIKLRGINRSAGEFMVKVFALDLKEEVLIERTVFLPSADKVSELKISLPAKNVRVLNIAIKYTGKIEKNDLIRIDTIDVRGGDKLNKKDQPSYAIEDIESFDFNSLDTLLKKESKLSKARIIGLGEAGHGSKAIGDLKNDFARSLIKSGQVNTILLEIPNDIVQLFDAYVQGLLSDTTQLVPQYLKIAYGYESTYGLLKWIRKHNENNTEKVHVFGIDNSVTTDNSYPLMDYLKEVLGAKAALPYLRLLDSRNLEGTKALALQDTALQKLLGKTNFKNYLWTLTDGKVNSIEDVFKERDLNMFRRVCQIDSMFNTNNKTMLVLAHSAHVSKTPEYDLKKHLMLGNYLKQQYGNTYYNLNFTFGSGSYVQDSISFRAIYTLDRLPVSSFEEFGMKTGRENFFYPTQKMNNGIGPILSITRNSRNGENFKLINPQESFDGFVFIRKSLPFTDYERSNFSYIFTMMKKKREEYKHLLN